MGYLDGFDPNKATCIDVETISFDDDKEAFEWWGDHRVSGFAIGQYGVEPVYLPIRHRTEDCLPYDDVVWELIEYANKCKKLLNFNLKFDLHMMARDGILFPNAELCDVQILLRLFDCNQEEMNLEYATKKYVPDEAKEGDPVKEWCRKNKTKDYGAVPLDLMSKYAKQDVRCTLALARYLFTTMQKEKYDFRVWETEKRLTRILFESEENGVEIDQMFLTKESIKRIQIQMECVDRLKEICGPDFDPGSSVQTKEYFHGQGIHTNNLTKTGQDKQKKKELIDPTEYESFGKDTLLEIINEFDDGTDLDIDDEEKLAANNGPRGAAYWLLKFNKEQTNYTTFCEGWLNKRNHETGRIHGNFMQPGTKTGRLSMFKPTLHNYPEWAAQALLIPEGCIGVEWDASQIEYRQFAHYAGQKDLYDAYAEDADLDFHQLMADKIGIPRKPSKTINFAILYGIGVKKLIRYLVKFILENDTPELRDKLRKFDPSLTTEGHITQETAELIATNIRRSFLRDNPGITKLQQKIQEGVAKRKAGGNRGYFQNFYGRRYHLDFDKLYRALNYLCQGSSADWFKETMVLIFDTLRPTITGANMMTNIHDSVKAWVEPEKAQEYWDVTVKIAQRDCFRVPIRIDGNIALRNWNNMYPIIGNNIAATLQVAENEDYYMKHYGAKNRDELFKLAEADL